ncbi:MAG: hypothetical protein R3280_14800, partial [Marinobacter sp.]|nr:hypothetical protein [Marinobacter sp.]
MGGFQGRTRAKLLRALTTILTGLPLAAVPAFAEPVGKADAVVSIAAPLYWCPYACDATTARWGYTVEIAR